MEAHRIRLRAPWRSEELDGGATAWTRPFHRPTNLGPSERVWLLLSGLPLDGTVELNGQKVGHAIAAVENRFEITAILADRNELVISLYGIGSNAGHASVPADVYLEIL